MSRTVRWLAQSLLLGPQVLKKHPYGDLPPLEELIILLCPARDSMEMFDVVGRAEEDGYFDDLHCYVEIMNWALNDVPAYVIAEKRSGAGSSATRATAAQSSTDGDKMPASPEKDKLKTELELIQNCLEVLHGKIGGCSVLLRQLHELMLYLQSILAPPTSTARVLRLRYNSCAFACVTSAWLPCNGLGAIERRVCELTSPNPRLFRPILCYCVLSFLGVSISLRQLRILPYRSSYTS